MTTTVVRLCSLTVWNGVAFSLDEQLVRLYWCVFGFEKAQVQYAVLTSPWCDVQMHYYNVDNDWVVMYVDCTERCCVGTGRAVGTFVLACTCTWSCHLCLCNWGLNLTLMCCPNTLQWRWRLRVCLCSLNAWHGVLLALDEQIVRLYRRLLEFEALLVLDVVWGRNLTLMRCPNTLQWWWWMYVYVRGTPRTNRKYDYICVCLDLKLLFRSMNEGSPWCTVQIRDNVNGGSARMFALDESLCVCIGVCLDLNLLFVFDAVRMRS